MLRRARAPRRAGGEQGRRPVRRARRRRAVVVRPRRAVPGLRAARAGERRPARRDRRRAARHDAVGAVRGGRAAPHRAARQAERRQVQPAQPRRRRRAIGRSTRSPARPSTRSTSWSSSAARPGGSSTPPASGARSRPRPARSTTRASVRTPRSSGARSRSSCSTPASRSTEQDQRIITDVVDAGRGLVLAFNKWDLVDEDRRPMLEREIERDLDRVAWAPRVNVVGARPAGTPTGSCRRCAPRSPAGSSASRPPGSTRSWARSWRGTPPPVRGGKQPKILFVTQAVDPAADVRAVHQRLPRGRLPALRRAPAARGVRLRRDAHPPRRPRPGAPQPLRLRRLR